MKNICLSCHFATCISPEGVEGETPSADELLGEVPNENLLEGKTANQSELEGEIPNEKVEGEPLVLMVTKMGKSLMTLMRRKFNCLVIKK